MATMSSYYANTPALCAVALNIYAPLGPRLIRDDNGRSGTGFSGLAEDYVQAIRVSATGRGLMPRQVEPHFMATSSSNLQALRHFKHLRYSPSPAAPSPGWGPRGQGPGKNNWTDHVPSGLPGIFLVFW